MGMFEDKSNQNRGLCTPSSQPLSETEVEAISEQQMPGWAMEIIDSETGETKRVNRPGPLPLESLRKDVI